MEPGKEKSENETFKTEKIERLVELALLTGFISDDKPVSLMLIAPQESAKTSILRGFRCPATIEAGDLSSKCIHEKIVPQLEKYKLNHIIIPDLTSVLSHRGSTVAATIGFINRVTEEGLLQNLFYGQTFEFDAPRVCGVITSITPDKFRQVAKQWNDIGLITRFLPLSYQYSDETTKEIHTRIQNNELFNSVNELTNKEKKYRIPIDTEPAAFINMICARRVSAIKDYKFRIQVQGGNTITIQLNINGFRLHKQLRQLARAIALSRDKRNPKVSFDDVRQLDELINFIGLPNDPKVI